jgi:uncharacterized phage protein gp47/JayE
MGFAGSPKGIVMAFERPTLSELIDRIQEDFVSRLTLAGAVLRRSVVYVLSRVIAGAAHMLHGHLDYLSRQLFPDQSDEVYLLRQGGLFGIDRNSPEFATGNVIFWGTNGTAIPISTVLVRSDAATFEVDAEVTIATLTAWAGATAYTVGQLRRNGGIIYQCITAGTSAGSGGPTGTDADITDNTVHWSHIATGTAAVIGAVTATEADEDGNCDSGTSLTFESPVASVNSTCTVDYDGLSGGTDEEDIEDYRERVIERMRSAPHGGSSADYVAWAKEVSGVTRAWVYPQELGVGTVTVRFVRDDDDDLIPSAGEVTTVQDYIDELRPVTADVTVAAPVSVALDFEIELTPDTSDIRAAVEAELEDFLARVAEPGEDLLLSQISTAIGNAEGVVDFVLTDPAADVTHSTGQLATMGTVTWL